jgi:phospholipid/cholesterol/gamma-HCH transport system substrate-binding protein
MTKSLSAATQSLSQIMKKMESNQGSLGRLVNDTTAVHDLHELATSMSKLMNDMRERPGRYFNVKVF